MVVQVKRCLPGYEFLREIYPDLEKDLEKWLPYEIDQRIGIQKPTSDSYNLQINLQSDRIN